MVEKDPILISKDVAHLLDIPPDDVIDLARKGKPKTTKDGRFWMFRLSDVKAYQEKKGKFPRTSI